MYQNYISDHTYRNASTHTVSGSVTSPANHLIVVNDIIFPSFTSDFISLQSTAGYCGYCSVVYLDHLHSMFTPFVCTAIGNVSVSAASAKGLSAFMFRYESEQPLSNVNNQILLDSTDLCIFPLQLSALSSDSKVVSFSFSGKSTVYAQPFISNKPYVYFGFGFTCNDALVGDCAITVSLNQVISESTPFQPLK